MLILQQVFLHATKLVAWAWACGEAQNPLEWGGGQSGTKDDGHLHILLERQPGSAKRGWRQRWGGCAAQRRSCYRRRWRWPGNRRARSHPTVLWAAGTGAWARRWATTARWTAGKAGEERRSAATPASGGSAAQRRSRPSAAAPSRKMRTTRNLGPGEWGAGIRCRQCLRAGWRSKRRNRRNCCERTRSHTNHT